MKRALTLSTLALASLLGVAALANLPRPVVAAPDAADPLPSWNEGPSKRAILDFVARVTNNDTADFVPPAERIATFDNDGTLWCEQPVYVQILFALDRLKALAPQHPEWKEKEPYKAALEGDMKAVLAGGLGAVAHILAATHAGMTTAEFEAIVTDWAAHAKNPVIGRLFTECVYQPMLEVLRYLRANDFSTYIVSGGGVEFMRPWAERVYGVRPEQVVGSVIKTKWEMRDGKPVLMRLPELDFNDDKEGKPIAIHQRIGRRPILAFGNSDGDLEMLQWTTAGDGPRLGLLVHHTDAEREWAYDRTSHIGRLDKALDDAPKSHWVVVDMKSEWNKVFPFPWRHEAAAPR